MKKIVTAGFITLAALSLTACGNNSNDSKSSKSNKAKSSWVKKTTVVKSTTTDTSDTDGDDAKKQSNAAEKLSVNLSAKNKFIDASIGKITIRQMSNGDEDNFTDAEENHDGDLPDSYYHTTLFLEIKNNTNKVIDLSYTNITLIDATGTTYAYDSQSHSIFTNSDDMIQPGAKLEDVIELIDEKKTDLSSFKLAFDGLCNTDGDQFVEPFTLEFK